MAIVGSASVEGYLEPGARPGALPDERARGPAARRHQQHGDVGRHLAQPAHRPRAFERLAGAAEDRFLAAQRAPPRAAGQARRAGLRHALRGRPALRGHVQDGRSRCTWSTCPMPRIRASPARSRCPGSRNTCIPCPTACSSGSARTRCRPPGWATARSPGTRGCSSRCTTCPTRARRASCRRVRHRQARQRFGPAAQPPCVQHAAARRRLATIAIPAAVHEGPVPYPGVGPSTTYPWSYSGLLRFELRGTTAADARLAALPTAGHPRHGSPNSYGPANDPGRTAGAPVDLRERQRLLGNGLFWRGDEAGNVTGPY